MTFIKLVMAGVLVYWAGETLVLRWGFGRVPTQVSGSFVAVALILSLYYAGRLSWEVWSSRKRGV